MISEFLAALLVGSIVVYSIVAWWCVVAYAEQLRGGGDRRYVRLDLVMVLGLLGLSVLALLTATDGLIRAVLSAMAGYRLIVGPTVRRSTSEATPPTR